MTITKTPPISKTSSVEKPPLLPPVKSSTIDTMPAPDGLKPPPDVPTAKDVLQRPPPAPKPSKIALDMAKRAQNTTAKLASQGVPPDMAKEMLSADLKSFASSHLRQEGARLDSVISKKAAEAKKEAFGKIDASVEAYKREQEKLIEQKARKKKELGAPYKQVEEEKEKEKGELLEKTEEIKQEKMADANAEIEEQKEEAKELLRDTLAEETQRLKDYAEDLSVASTQGDETPLPPISLVQPVTQEAPASNGLLIAAGIGIAAWLLLK